MWHVVFGGSMLIYSTSHYKHLHVEWYLEETFRHQHFMMYKHESGRNSKFLPSVLYQWKSNATWKNQHWTTTMSLSPLFGIPYSEVSKAAALLHDLLQFTDMTRWNLQLAVAHECPFLKNCCEWIPRLSVSHLRYRSLMVQSWVKFKGSWRFLRGLAQTGGVDSHVKQEPHWFYLMSWRQKLYHASRVLLKSYSEGPSTHWHLNILLVKSSWGLVRNWIIFQ